MRPVLASIRRARPRRSALGVAATVLGLAAAAFAFFTSTGSGTASTSVGTLQAPTITSATAGAGSVTLTWSSVSPPVGSSPVKYYVSRGGGNAGGNCPTTPSAVTTCTDTGLSRGSYSYTVTAVWQTWSATSSSTSASVSSGTATQIVLSGAVSDLGGGATRTFTATVQDGAGNTVTTGADSTATITFAQTGGSGTITGTGSSTATNGVATKTITGGTAGTITLRANATINSTTTNSNTLTFNTVPGTATTVTVSSGASQSATVGAAFGAPLVALVSDSAGNPVSGVTVTFTAPSSGASGTFANSTATTTAVSGSDGKATSSAFTANTTAGSYSISASASGTTSASFALTNNPAAASKLSFNAQPAAGANVQATGTGTFSVSIAVQDSYGNTRTSDGSTTVTLSLNSNPGGGTLSCTGGTGPVTVSAGVATFSGCAITKVGSGYTLTASSAPALTAPANANSFNITPGAASKLAFTQQPSNSTGGISFGTQPKVTVQDQNGNTVTGNTSNVTLAVATNPGGGTLACTSNPVAASGGVATFGGCNIDKAGNGYTLTATDGSLSSATSNAFNITVGAAAQLAFTQQPNGAQAGIAFVTQPKVAVEDAGGNVVTTDASTVTLAIGANPGGGTLSGCSGVRSSGVTTFSGCAISAGAAGYTLTATDGSLTSATSSAFTVFSYARTTGAGATSGTTVATANFTLAANTTYVVFAFSDSGTTGDSVSVTPSAFTSNPAVTTIGSASYDSKDIEYAGYLTGGSGTGKLTATFAKTIKQAYIQVIAVKGAASSPIAQNAFATMTGTTASNPATANLPSAPDARDGELVYWTSDQSVATPTSSSSAITFLASTSSAATSGSQSIFGGAPAQQTESLTMSAAKTWGTIALEIKHG